MPILKIATENLNIDYNLSEFNTLCCNNDKHFIVKFIYAFKVIDLYSYLTRASQY